MMMICKTVLILPSQWSASETNHFGPCLRLIIGSRGAAELFTPLLSVTMSQFLEQFTLFLRSL